MVLLSSISEVQLWNPTVQLWAPASSVQLWNPTISQVSPMEREAAKRCISQLQLPGISQVQRAAPTSSIAHAKSCGSAPASSIAHAKSSSIVKVVVVVVLVVVVGVVVMLVVIVV
jgi:hypothetical protein